jgi:hypothetical protein
MRSVSGHIPFPRERGEGEVCIHTATAQAHSVSKKNQNIEHQEGFTGKGEVIVCLLLVFEGQNDVCCHMHSQSWGELLEYQKGS